MNRPLVGELRFLLALAVLALWTLLLAPFQWVFTRRPVLRAWPAGATRLPHLYHRVAAPVIGARIHVHGALAVERPLLILANHVSWLDIPVLSAVAPVSFVAKSEMRDWPLFGWLARAQRTVFVDRKDRRGAGRQADALARRLEAGDVMVLFAEGTTSDGSRVLPFNASLLGAASALVRDGTKVMVQPVALSYTRAHGMAAGIHGLRPIGWPGTVGLLPHLPDTLREGALDVHVSLAAPIPFEAPAARKRVAAAAHRAIRDMRARDIRGVPLEPTDDARSRDVPPALTGGARSRAAPSAPADDARFRGVPLEPTVDSG